MLGRLLSFVIHALYIFIVYVQFTYISRSVAVSPSCHCFTLRYGYDHHHHHHHDLTYSIVLIYRNVNVCTVFSNNNTLANL